MLTDECYPWIGKITHIFINSTGENLFQMHIKRKQIQLTEEKKLYKVWDPWKFLSFSIRDMASQYFIFIKGVQLQWFLTSLIG